MEEIDWKNDVVKVAEQLYKDENPNSTMDCPNSVYITCEKWYNEFIYLGRGLTFYDWCKEIKDDRKI